MWSVKTYKENINKTCEYINPWTVAVVMGLHDLTRDKRSWATQHIWPAMIYY